MKYPDSMIESLLQPFEKTVGVDYEKYKLHVYRVFFNCLLLDNTPEHREQYAIAAVFHDIGIWTAHTIDYLPPSIAQAQLYLQQSGKDSLEAAVVAMIYWHHKIKKYSGSHAQLVETFRRADWMDVTLGCLTFGANKQTLRMYRKQLPNAGFHLFLLKKIAFNFFRHPLHPLPMFKN